MAISNLKALEEADVINMLFFINTLEEIKAQQKQTVLLLELSPLIHLYLYQSLSVFITYLTDKGKLYLKLTANNSEQFMQIITHFVANKNKFKGLR